jgi:SAM-dependent methyltransferase
MPMRRLRRIRHSIASSGLLRTLADLANQGLSIRSLAYRAEEDRSFDRRFGTDTAGSVHTDQLGIDNPAVRDKAIRYLPSPPNVTRWMLRNSGVDPAGYSFIDLGCGKGRVLLLAAGLPFRQVVGVDISAELCAVARRNAALLPVSRTSIEVRAADATLLDFPDTDLLIHMYHPFDPELTVRVFERLGESLARRPRKVRVAYLLYTAAVPAVEAAFARIPWLRRTRYEHSVTGQYDWLFYANDGG